MIIRTPFPVLMALAATVCEPSEAVAVSHSDAVFTVTSSLGKRSGLSEGAKNGISVAVTLAFILLVGSVATYCVIRRRRKVLQRPARAPAAIAADEGIHFEPTYLVKGKQNALFTNSPSVAGQPSAPGQQPMFQQPANEFAYPSQPACPTIPQPQTAYIPQQSTHTASHSSRGPVDDHSYNGTIPTAPSPSNNGVAGPSYSQSYSQYHPATQPLQYEQHANGAGWVQPEPISSAPITRSQVQSHDFQYNYQSPAQLAHQTQDQPLSRSQSRYQTAPVSATMTSFDDITSSNMYLIPEHIPQPTGDGEDYEQIYQAGFDSYHVPPPHAHASELPEQRKPLELMGEGHYKELH
ncbi:hypothetical protein GGR57DRAFT_473497 [Xylariaceae sp. FL1272]|nr:hypothetical protein GGR57DRAFT_473497 [Xylariaceae sp. FL1272]